MKKLKDNQRGFSAVEVVLVFVIVALIGVAGWLVYKNHHKITTTASTTTSTTKPATTSTTTNNTTSTQASNPYSGWQTYTNSQVSFKYPSDWKASNGPGDSQSTVADATSPAFISNAVTTADNPGAPITLYLQLSTDSLNIDCADAPCQVTAVAPLNNLQLPGDVLAVANQTSGSGTEFTEYVVASGNTKVGDTTINAVKTGSSSIYVFGQAYYTPSGGGLTEAARLSDVTAFQADSHFKDLVNLINSIKFD